MDAKVVAFYRKVYDELSVDQQESAELTDFLESINPPPDKLLWLRSTAFRIGSEYIDASGNEDKLVALLRAINCVTHAIETTCMQEAKKGAGGDAVPFDEGAVTAFFTDIFTDLSVDREESEDVLQFFQTTHRPGGDDLVTMRATAFKVATKHLASDKETNVKLLKSVNAVVDAFERSCLEPKPFKLVVAAPSGGGGGGGGGHASAAFDLDVNLSDAVQKLWDLDDNRLDPQRDYKINVQSGKKPYHKDDEASEPLFDSVDTSVFKQRATYKTFIALLDNYSAETGVQESTSNAERREVQDFIAAVMQTKPMQYCHLYCRAKNPGMVPAGQNDFANLLKTIWFELYRRSGQVDSSGFEHVFVGEIKNGEISGFHNWVQFYLQEQNGSLDYRGYIKPRSCNDALPDESDQLLTLQFTWKGVEKMVGSSFIGVSPEFEFALYTMCFLAGEEENQISLRTGGCENDAFGVCIKCYKMAGDKIGTSFPEIQNHFEE